MKIKNDQVTFEESDFDGLSDFAKKALPPYSGTTPFIETFANQINEHIRIAKELAKQTVAASDPKIEAVLAGFVAADDIKREEAQKCLDELQIILDVAVPVPFVEP